VLGRAIAIPRVSATLPYQPFVEAFESFARRRDAELLSEELGSGVPGCC
jgi:hypothetical protein